MEAEMAEPILRQGRYFSQNEDGFSGVAMAFLQHVPVPFSVGLYGDLGAGKTTFVRQIVRAFLPGTLVKSPTYSLVEPYYVTPASTTGVRVLYHCDLYRLSSASELTALDIEACFSQGSVCFIEWPALLAAQPGIGFDLSIHWEEQVAQHAVDTVYPGQEGKASEWGEAVVPLLPVVRVMRFSAHTPAGCAFFSYLAPFLSLQER